MKEALPSHSRREPSQRADNEKKSGEGNILKKSEMQIYGLNVLLPTNNMKTELNQTSLKQRRLLWENYLIGKRIIETPSVICKKKFDNEYKKHRQIILSRNKKQFVNIFRQKSISSIIQNSGNMSPVQPESPTTFHLKKGPNMPSSSIYFVNSPLIQESSLGIESTSKKSKSTLLTKLSR